MLAGNLVAGWQMARALLVAEQQLAAGDDAGVHARQDRHRALLRRPHPEQGAGHARQHRRRRGGRDRAAGRVALTPLSPRDSAAGCATHTAAAAVHPRSPLAAAPVLAKLPLPVIGAPLFIISNPKLVIAQCKAGVVGSMPALNARPASQLDEWLAEITETLAA